MADPHFEQKDEGESDVPKAPREEIQAIGIDGAHHLGQTQWRHGTHTHSGLDHPAVTARSSQQAKLLLVVIGKWRPTSRQACTRARREMGLRWRSEMGGSRHVRSQ